MPTVSVIIKSSKLESDDLEFQVEAGEVLFEALEKQGKILPNGCLAGSCGSCKIYISEGLENLSEAKTVERDTISSLENELPTPSGKSLRLSCRARVNGPIQMEVPKKESSS